MVMQFLPSNCYKIIITSTFEASDMSLPVAFCFNDQSHKNMHQ